MVAGYVGVKVRDGRVSGLYWSSPTLDINRVVRVQLNTVYRFMEVHQVSLFRFTEGLFLIKGNRISSDIPYFEDDMII